MQNDPHHPEARQGWHTEDILTEVELARHWHKSVRTLQRWRAEAYGPAYLRIGGTIHYRVADVFAFEQRMRVRGGSSS